MSDIADLLAFLDASPTPFHATAEAARRLEAGGFTRVWPTDAWPSEAGGRYVRQGGSIIAWRQPEQFDPEAGLRILGAHTDSPNLRLKPRPEMSSAGWAKLGVEVYGGAIWASWLDRDLGLAGRIVLADRSEQLVRIDRPLLRIPSVAIHMNRSVNTEGMKLDPQRDLSPVWALEASGTTLAEVMAAEAGVDADEILAWDLMCHDTSGAATLGANHEMISSARLDNLLSCWAALTALLRQGAPGPLPVVSLFDHEEIGSQSPTGAASVLLSRVLERIATAAGASRQDWQRALASSYAVSADGAHATHPNRPELHDPAHQIRLDGGPVLKHNANLRYATGAPGAAWLRSRAARSEVPLQDFVMRNDMPCGSTIGPPTAAGLGVTTVDVGAAQLSMHSARELCGSTDAERLAVLLGACLAG